jgi:hypothetical protein
VPELLAQQAEGEPAILSNADMVPPKGSRRLVSQNDLILTYGLGEVLTFTSVFSVLVVVAGDGFTTVVLVSFFSAGGFITVVSFCSQAANRATPMSRQTYFFIQMNRI